MDLCLGVNWLRFAIGPMLFQTSLRVFLILRIQWLSCAQD